MNLDDLPRFKALDPQDMIGHINAMPDHIERTWSRAQALPLPNRFAQADKVVICGMGGSAIGGELVAFALADQSRAPIMVNRGYDLPAFATGEDTLVVACSHSGDTEETLAAFAQAGARGAQRMAICTGGALRAQADEAGVVTWTYDYASQPRAALGFSLTLLLALAHRLGLARDLDAAVAEAVAVMRGQTAQFSPEAPTGANPAKQLAAALFGRIPVVYGAGILTPVARRWKTQFNENSKLWAHFEVMPELDHNAVVGISQPAGLPEMVGVVMLRSAFDTPRIAQRFEETRNLLLQRNVDVPVETFSGEGESRLAQMLSTLRCGDYVSYYLAMAGGVDPTPVEPIALLKRKLGAFAG